MKKAATRILLAITFISLLVGFSATTTFAAGESWLTGWANRIKITIDHTKISSSLSNFPILVHLSESSGIGSSDVSAVFSGLTSDSNRRKMAVTTSDGITQCYIEISYFSYSAKQAALWVKAPSVSNSVDTILYLYYDKAHVDNTAYIGDTGSTPAQKVWDSNFAAVWHLVESGNGTTGEYKDSTANGNNGTGGNGVASRAPTRVINELGLPAESFAGSGTIRGYIQIPSSSSLSIPVPGGFTVEGALSPHQKDFTTNWTEGTLHYVPWINKATPSGDKEWMSTIYDLTGLTESRVGWTNWYNCQANTSPSPGTDYRTAYTLDSWLYLGMTTLDTDSQHGTIHIYRSGVENGTDGDWTEAGGITYKPSSAPIKIGGWDVGNGGFWFPGRIKEIRISNIARSTAWLKACSYSQEDNLLNFQVSSSTPLAVTTNAPSGLSTSGATLNANLTGKGTASSVTVSFEYGLTTGYGSTANGVPSTLTNTGAFNASLSGLTSNTLYHYRAKAEGDGTTYGSDKTFTTSTANSAPVFNAIGNKSVAEGALLSFTIYATDADGDTLTYSASNLPSGAAFNASTRVFSWTPNYAQAGSYPNVHFQVSDDSLSDSEDIIITVSASSPDWDVNLDGAVNVLDMISLGQHWAESGSTGWIREDINKDGLVNTLDSILIGQHWTG
jgi:hypothetical protein